jgi:hypothetical protein
MIELPRREAGRFRALARRCVVGRPRGPAPPVLLRQARDALTLSADLGGVALSLRLPNAADTECDLVVPFGVFDAVEGNDPASASIAPDDSGRIRCRWTDRGQSRESVFETTDPGPVLPTSRPRLRSVDPSFLAALHECGRTSAREGVRYAFSRLQLNGKEGQVIATDGRQLLVWKGFELPFADRVLVPAIPAFGHRELAASESVRVGRAGGQILVEAGIWTVGLTIDEGAKFPEVELLLARSGSGAALRIAERDAEAVLRRLDLVRSENPQSVTLEIGPSPEVVLGTTRIPLAESEATGITTAAVQSPHFQRALQLGLHSVRTDRAGATVLFEDERRSYLVTVASPESAAPAEPSSATAPCTRIQTISQEGGASMPSSKNGHATTDPGDGEEVLDPIAEAEAVKSALGEAGRRVGRLIASLRQIHKQRRVLQTAWTSLKQLGLGAREEP